MYRGMQDCLEDRFGVVLRSEQVEDKSEVRDLKVL